MANYSSLNVMDSTMACRGLVIDRILIRLSTLQVPDEQDIWRAGRASRDPIQMGVGPCTTL